MLAEQQIDRIATEAASRFLPPSALLQVSSRPDVSFDGDDMLRVLFVLREASLGAMTGRRAIDVLQDLQDRLRAAGEMRFASIEYATDAELAQNGGS